MRKVLDVLLLAALWPAGALLFVCVLPAMAAVGVALLLAHCLSQETVDALRW